MKTIKLFFINVVLLASACSQEVEMQKELLPEGTYPLLISVATSGENFESRVDESSDGSFSVFEADDQFCVQFSDKAGIGLYKIGGNAGTSTPINPIYWSKSEAEVFGWYPQETTVSLADQSSKLAYVMRAEPRILYYQSATNTLTFTNQLAKVRISFEFIGVDESVNDINEVQIKSYTSCTHEKGVIVSPDASASEDNYIKMHKATYNGKTYWEANLVPGVLSAAAALKFKRNGGEETIGLDSDVTLEAGKLSLITIPVHDNSYKYVCLNSLTAETTISEKSILNGTTSQKIIIADGSAVILCGAIINNQIKCEGDATIHLLSENVVTCSSNERAGIEAGPAGKTLKIDGSGKLTVTGGSDGAGIGSGYQSSCGAITIKGGTVNATGGEYGAGIGSGKKSSCGAITITGGTVNATGGFLGAGIGSGANSSCGAITITGGKVTAMGGNWGAGIGSGGASYDDDTITITGGTVNATGGNGGAGIGSGYGSSCGNITIDGVSDIRAKAGKDSACVGKGKYNKSIGDIKVTGCTNVILDNSASNSSYFDPTPSDIAGSTFYDKDGNEITI